MKFNSVEISGFRIYDDPKNATFNFVTDKGETADFVSLFAPNGFGKTSFYDAIEWAVTNNVDRFSINKHTSKSIATLRALTSKQIKLYKNNQTSNDTWVKILNSDNEVFKKRELKIPTQRATDYDKRKEEWENLDFLKVILSQEWISSFLKEIDGKARYKKFMENNTSLQEVDIYYQDVITLCKANDKKISALKKAIEESESKIDETFKEDLLITTNAQIEKLNRLSLIEKLNKIEVTTTKKEITSLRNKLSDLLADDTNLKQVQNLLNHIDSAKIGNDKLYSQKQFFESKNKLIDLLKVIDGIKDNLSDFKKLSATKNELEQKLKTKETLTILLKELANLQRLIPEYIETNNKILQKNKTKSVKQKEFFTISENIEISQRKLIEDEENHKNSERQRLKVSQQLEKIPKLENDLKSLEKAITDLKKKLEIQRKQATTTSKNYNELEAKIDELIKVRKELKIGQYSETSLGEDKNQIKNLTNLEKLDALNLKYRKELAEIQYKIDSQESLNKSINDFIASGLTLVNQQQTDSCPLCEQTYENYSTLAERISNNKALSDSIKALLKERTLKKNDIDRNQEDREELIHKLEQFYVNKLDGLQSEIKMAKELKDDQQKLFDETNLNLSFKNAELLDLKSKFTEDTINKYEDSLKAQLKKIIETKKADEEKLKKTKDNNQKFLSDKNQVEKTINLLEEEIQKLIANRDYVVVNEWAIKNLEEDEEIEDFVKEQIDKKEKDVGLLDTQISSLKKIEKTLSIKLKKFNENQLDEELTKKLSQQTILELGIESYKYHLIDKLSLETGSFKDSSLTKTLKSMEEDVLKKLKEQSSLNIEIKKLQGYTENILPFLQSEKAKIDLAAFKKQLNFVKNKVGKLLYEETERTKNYLDEQIKAFFYEKLINEIYGKIDPHPSFKNVQFIATFTDTSPSLDVYVKNSEDDNVEDSLIPNLYFSTAQINILSLSIFLASALNSKDYDCIFIDDPIQSMDSINVLSTIDLLRSIVVNNKKQIILSTHDENFHNLLKMKIPSKLFKSKFLELEGFGKLKPESQRYDNYA